MALTQVSTGGIKDGQVHTADLADAQITAGKLHADALDHTYTLGAVGSDHYTFTGEGLTGAVNDPTLYLTRGKTYRFVNGNSSGAHPFRIQSVAGAGGTEYNTGVTNNAGAGGSTIIFEVPHDAPDVLYYICTSHPAMNGIFYVTGALADGSVTTAKLANDAVTRDKIADDVIASEHFIAGEVDTTALATNAVTSAKIADGAVTLAKLPHGDGSSDGKFLRANNGADPSFETVSIPAGTTINNNADNRVITGSGTANTLNGESNVHINGGKLLVGTSTPAPYSTRLLTVGDASYNDTSLEIRSNSSTGRLYFTDSASAGTGAYMGGIQYHHTDNSMRFETNGGTERLRINNNGDVIHQSSSHTYAAAYKNLSNSHSSYGMNSSGILLFNTAIGGMANSNQYNTSNGRYTAPIKGFYLVQFRGLIDNSRNTGSACNVWLYKNGSNTNINIYYESIDYSSYKHVSGSSVLPLEANDYIELRENGAGALHVSGETQMTISLYRAHL